MLRCAIEENAAGSQQKKTKKQDAAAAQAVLFQSTRHNLQVSSNHGGICLKGKSTASKADGIKSACTLNRVVKNDVMESAFPSNMEEGGSSDLCTSSKIKALEDKVSAKSSEIDELKVRLQDAKMQTAEVVAQSAILVRDMQCAASKEIADVLRRVHSFPGVQSKCVNGFVCSDKGLSVSSSTKLGRGFHHVEVKTTEQELVSTRQELADCRLMLAEMKKQLDRTSLEKEKLEFSLRSSMQTSLKLQDTLKNQKVVMQLELLATEERSRNEVAFLVQSARSEAKHSQEQLNAALSSKEELECSLRNCIQLLCHAQNELLTCRASAKRQHWFESVVSEKLQKVELEREYLVDIQAQSLIKWTVLECVWEGAVNSLLSSFDMCIAESSFLDETHASYVEKKTTPRLQTRKWSLEGELTPLKASNLLATPRSAFSGEDGLKRPFFKSPHGRIGFLQQEAALRENLIKSEHKVEILGDKVDELRIVLEKVTSLLDCISKSSVSGHGTTLLMRRIIEQLQTFECDYSSTPDQV